ncbi:MAG: hypothetical protein AAF518_10510 [Spirochaetota bacterium]
MKRFTKPALVVASFSLLLYFILFSPKKQEDSRLITLWKVDVDEVIYTPPQDKKTFSKFLSQKLYFKRDYPNLKAIPFFTVSGENGGEKYLYEGGYNSKNLFRELSVPKTVFLQDATEELKKKFSLSESSPSLEAYHKGKLHKKIYLGIPDRNGKYRYAWSKNEIYKLYGFTARRFTKPIQEFRDKSILYLGEGSISSLVSKTAKEKVFLQQQIQKNGKHKISIWKRGKTDPVRIAPSLGEKLKNSLKKMAINRFPDEDTEGFAIIKELVKAETVLQLEVNLDTSVTYQIKVFPQVELDGNVFSPTIANIKGRFTESPYYTYTKNINSLAKVLGEIKAAKQWTPPIKKANQTKVPKK